MHPRDELYFGTALRPAGEGYSRDYISRPPPEENITHSDSPFDQLESVPQNEEQRDNAERFPEETAATKYMSLQSIDIDWTA